MTALAHSVRHDSHRERQDCHVPPVRCCYGCLLAPIPACPSLRLTLVPVALVLACLRRRYFLHMLITVSGETPSPVPTFCLEFSLSREPTVTSPNCYGCLLSGVSLAVSGNCDDPMLITASWATPFLAEHGQSLALQARRIRAWHCLCSDHTAMHWTRLQPRPPAQQVHGVPQEMAATMELRAWGVSHCGCSSTQHTWSLRPARAGPKRGR